MVLSAAAWHAALGELRARGSERENDSEAAAFLIDALLVLEALANPAHQARPTFTETAGAAAAQQGATMPGATAPAANCPPPANAGTPAPPTIELSAGPGALHGAVVDTPAAEGATKPASDLRQPEQSAPSAPPPAQAAEGHPPATTTPGKWTRERIALLTEHLPTCVDRPALLARVNDLPGLPIASVKAMMVKARDLEIPIEAWVPRAIETAAGARGGRSTETGTPTKTSEVRTAERFAAFPALWMDPALSVPEIHARMNAMPGAPVKTSTQLYGWAKKAGLPTQRPLPPADFEEDSDEGAAAAEDDPPPEAAAPPPEPPQRETPPRGNSQFRGASLPAVPDEKAEVFDAFTAGQTVRDVAADFGLPLSTLSTWHAEWKLAQRQKDAAA